MDKEKLRKEIEEATEKLNNKKVCMCERYSRIVGYYRSYASFNLGKLEEARIRKNYIIIQEGV